MTVVPVPPDFLLTHPPHLLLGDDYGLSGSVTDAPLLMAALLVPLALLTVAQLKNHLLARWLKRVGNKAALGVRL